MWEELSRGALGALVLVDPDRLDEAFPVLDLVEKFDLAMTIGVNTKDGTPKYDLDEIREALLLPAEIPVVNVDARSQQSSAEALITLVQHLMSTLA
jgi:signal recognition particle receptor subunit beta